MHNVSFAKVYSVGTPVVVAVFRSCGNVRILQSWAWEFDGGSAPGAVYWNSSTFPSEALGRDFEFSPFKGDLVERSDLLAYLSVRHELTEADFTVLLAEVSNQFDDYSEED